MCVCSHHLLFRCFSLTQSFLFLLHSISAPDAASFISLLGTEFTSYYDSIKFNWAQYAGAKVLTIAGMPAYSYVDHIATTYSGNYLDHGVRVNSVFSSYRISGGVWSQRFGDLAGPIFPDLEGLTFELIKNGSHKIEKVTFPYRASYIGATSFTDKASFWAANCAVKNTTNGIDYFDAGKARESASMRPFAAIVLDSPHALGVGLPTKYQPTAPNVTTGDVIRAYTLTGKYKGTGVVRQIGMSRILRTFDLLDLAVRFAVDGRKLRACRLRRSNYNLPLLPPIRLLITFLSRSVPAKCHRCPRRIQVRGRQEAYRRRDRQRRWLRLPWGVPPFGACRFELWLWVSSVVSFALRGSC